MEPVTLGVVAAALIAKALDRAENGAVDGAVQMARKAVDSLHRRFAGDAEVESALEALVEVPDSNKREKALAELLEVRARESAELRVELESIAEMIEGAQVKIGDIEQVVEGDGNVQVAGTLDSQINISQNSSPRE